MYSRFKETVLTKINGEECQWWATNFFIKSITAVTVKNFKIFLPDDLRAKLPIPEEKPKQTNKQASKKKKEKKTQW